MMRSSGFQPRGLRPTILVAFFLVLTAGVLLGLALVVGPQFGSSIRAETLRGAEGTGEVFFSIALEPEDYPTGRLGPGTYSELNENVGVSKSIVGARLWDARGRLLHESGAARLGAVAKPSAVLRTAFRGGVRSEVAPEPAVPSGKEVRTYVPVPRRGGPVRQVLELDSAYEPVGRDIADRKRRLHLILLAAACLLYLALLPTVIRGSRALSDRYRASHVPLQRALRRALDRDELVLHYQPQLDVRTGEVSTVEALARWNHPGRGTILPLEFFPQVEQTSVALPLTLRVFELAFARMAAWRREGIEVCVAVNVAPPVLAEPELARSVERLLHEHGVRGRDVIVEITESAIGQASALATLAHFKSLGFKLSIDDFGTGHSSLVRLDTLPLDQLKIDRSFISRLAEGGSPTLVAGMVSLAHELGLSVVAEGVESQEIGELLARLGCDSIQGFHIARPLPGPDATSWLLSARAAPRRVARHV